MTKHGRMPTLQPAYNRACAFLPKTTLRYQQKRLMGGPMRVDWKVAKRLRSRRKSSSSAFHTSGPSLIGPAELSTSE